MLKRSEYIYSLFQTVAEPIISITSATFAVPPYIIQTSSGSAWQWLDRKKLFFLTDYVYQIRASFP
jgi:hypothetical protein